MRPFFLIALAILATAALPAAAGASGSFSGGAGFSFGDGGHSAAGKHWKRKHAHHGRHARRGHKGRHGGGHRRSALPVIVKEEARPATRTDKPDLTIRARFTAPAGPAGRSYYSSWVAACVALHESFDARTGTYVAGNGAVRRCE